MTSSLYPNSAKMAAQASLAENAVKIYADYRQTVDNILRQVDEVLADYENEPVAEAVANKHAMEAIRAAKRTLDAKMKVIEKIAVAVQAL